MSTSVMLIPAGPSPQLQHLINGKTEVTLSRSGQLGNHRAVSIQGAPAYTPSRSITQLYETVILLPSILQMTKKKKKKEKESAETQSDMPQQIMTRATHRTRFWFRSGRLHTESEATVSCCF